MRILNSHSWVPNRLRSEPARGADGAVDGPDADHAIGVSGEQGTAVRRPLQGGAERGDGLLAHRGELGVQFIDDGFGFEVPDLDAGLRRRAQPVPVRGEAQSVDDVPGIEGVQALAFGEVPEHRDAVLTAGGAEGAVGGHGDGVDVPGVSHEVGSELAVGQVPHLDELIPAA